MTRTNALHNRTANGVLATHVARATNAWSRGIGLLGRKAVAAHEGLWIGGCSAIHTVGMRATIDVIFLDRDGTVLKFEPAVAPGRLVVSCPGARAVVELGVAASRTIAIGDRLALE